MLYLGFRAHDFGKFDSPLQLAKAAASFREAPCLHLAPYKSFSDAPKPLTEEWAADAFRQFEREKVKVAILGCYINPIHPDPEKENAALESFENGIDIAKYLGNPIVATETGSVNPANVRCEETWTEKTFTRFLNNMERLLNQAVSKNVTIAIEAVADKNTIDTPQRMLKVMENFRSPNLKVLFDAVNILPIRGLTDFEGWYDEALSMLHPYICAMHIKDYLWTEKSKEYPDAQGLVKNGNIPVGEGLFPWKTIFGLYGKYNLTGVPMTLECFKPETLRQSLEYVEKCLI